ncbi:dephospho-CoA kinase [Candidatus Pelagibacter sp.]|nr:dephospho-CoA kinase [Candidatus Pelagibacter sp.]
MIRAAVIGSIGSGKTFVAKLFKCPVFSADHEVKIIYKTSKACFNKLKKILPIYIKSFPIKKKELVEAISKDKKNLKKISSIVHPLVRKKMNLFLKKNKNQKIVLLDIPLLIENKLNKKEDILIFIKSKKSKILHRLKKRPNFNLEFLKNLQENQTKLSKKIKLANYIVHNNYSANIMKKKIKLLKKKILDERNRT